MSIRLAIPLLILCACLCDQVVASDVANDTASDQEATDFRKFTDKRGKQIEARIVSISDDLQAVNLERRDGQTIELSIVILSLDDQQFLREWLYPSRVKSSGEIQVFGFLPKEKPIDADALAGVDDIVSLHASKQGWLALRESGEVLSFEDRFPDLTNVLHLDINTVWLHLTRRDGTVGGLRGGIHHPNFIDDAVWCAGGNGHAAVVMRNGTVKVWGRLYGSQELTDPPVPLTDIVALASAQGRMAALDKGGKVFSWAAGKSEVFVMMLGDGVVEMRGSVFDHLALTKSGEVFTWNKPDVTKATTPKLLQGEGRFQKIRCNGATRAAQREDGSWIAWGRNSSGIVDHINELGPASDIAFFSEPGKQDCGYVIWRE